jgi:hypothetical protein
VVDDFGVKFTNTAAANHLIDTLEKLYQLKVSWTGEKYLGFLLQFDTVARSVALSMPGYIDKVLLRFPPSTQRGAASPAVYTPPHYGSKMAQAPTSIDTSPLLTASERYDLQAIVGSLLYYARGVDPTMLPRVSELSCMQSKATQHTLQSADRLLQYCARYRNNAIVFYACDMIYHVQTDASFNSRPNGKSVAGAIHYLGNRGHPEQINGALLASSNVIHSVVVSAAEAEYVAAFLAAQEGAVIRQLLQDLGYPQPATILLCDNRCAVGIATNTVKANRTKSIDNKYHWLRDQIHQQHFQILWRSGKDLLADFFTKPLPVNVHLAFMPLLVYTPTAPNNQWQSAHSRRTSRSRCQYRRVCPAIVK